MFTQTNRFILFLIALHCLGCNDNPTEETEAQHQKNLNLNKTDVQPHDHDHHHDHDRDKMKASHLGPYHVWLTAHLSAQDGNELDLFVEEANSPKPVALSFVELRGKATRLSDDTIEEVMFVPAPSNERPAGETDGCSHYVAKTPWLNPKESYTVVIEVELNGRVRKATWRNFTPSNFAHHVE